MKSFRLFLIALCLFPILMASATDAVAERTATGPAPESSAPVCDCGCGVPGCRCQGDCGMRGPGPMGGRGMMEHRCRMHSGMGMSMDDDDAATADDRGCGMQGDAPCGAMGRQKGGCGMMGGMGMRRGGCGMTGMGPGMMGRMDREALDATQQMRRELHIKRFDFREALRDPKVFDDEILKMRDNMERLELKIRRTIMQMDKD